MRKIFLIIVLSLSLRAAESRAAPAPYKLEFAGEIARLRKTSSGEIVWKIKAAGQKFYWAPNRRALFLGNYIWREGSFLLRVSTNPRLGNAGDHYDYPMGDYIWSPDNRKIIVRWGISGMIDIGPEGAGPIFCLQLTGTKRHPRYQWKRVPTSGRVWKMRWRDKNTVAYWIIDDAYRPLPQVHIARVA